MYEQIDPAKVTRDALVRDHAQRMTRGPKIPMPQGQRVSAEPYIGVKYPGEDATLMLGNPGLFLKEPKVGYVYLWKVRDDRRTAALLRAKHIRPVEMHELDEDNPMAEVVELKTASGDFVLWESHALFEMRPEIVKRYYIDYERYAVGRLADHAMDFAGEIRSASTEAYAGDIRLGGEKVS